MFASTRAPRHTILPTCVISTYSMNKYTASFFSNECCQIASEHVYVKAMSGCCVRIWQVECVDSYFEFQGASTRQLRLMIDDIAQLHQSLDAEFIDRMFE